MRMVVKHLKTSDYRVMPWKNGGGATTEIAIDPVEATLAAPFTWRVSLAHLGGSGPFSAFPDYDRHIVQLAGEPMRLDHPGLGSQQLTPFVPYRFRGEWATEGVLPRGAARDFNVMTRRGKAAAHVECLVLAAGRPVRRTVAGALLVYVVAGSVDADGERVAEHETVVARGDGALSLGGDGARVIVVSIEAHVL